jgi:hypothetical protein
VVSIISSWHGHTWLSVEDDHNVVIKDAELNVDVEPFRLRMRWYHTVILSIRNIGEKVTFAGHQCRKMGDRYDDEVKRYNGEDK